MLVKFTKGNLQSIKTKDFKLEKELQNFFESNIQGLTGYKFLKSEFVVDDYRLDSVAFNEENNSFVIVEYKRGKNESLVDQGYAYLNKLLMRKADFVLLYNECTGETRGKDYFDWTQSKIIFVSPKFTQNQLDATSFGSMAFELYRVNRYEGDLYTIEQPNQKKIHWEEESFIKSIKTQPNTVVDNVNKELVVYDENYHFEKANASNSTIDLYHEMKDRLLEMDADLKEVFNKPYITYKYDPKHNLVSFWIKKDWIEIVLNAKLGELIDNYNILQDISNRRWTASQYAIKLNIDSNIDNIMDIIKQLYRLNTQKI